jgi:drug/metabolite transporter (DMT)-like permease
MSEPTRTTGHGPYVAVAATVLLTVYGQGIVKWRVDHAGAAPPGLGGQLERVSSLALDPWVWTAGLAVLAASLAWLAALSRLDLSVAYPLMSVSLVLVVLLGVVAFGEGLSPAKLIGSGLVVCGLVVATRREDRDHPRVQLDRPDS